METPFDDDELESIPEQDLLNLLILCGMDDETVNPKDIKEMGRALASKGGDKAKNVLVELEGTGHHPQVADLEGIRHDLMYALVDSKRMRDVRLSWNTKAAKQGLAALVEFGH